MIVIMSQDKTKLMKVSTLEIINSNRAIQCIDIGGAYAIVGRYESGERTREVLEDIKKCIQIDLPTYDMPEQ